MQRRQRCELDHTVGVAAADFELHTDPPPQANDAAILGRAVHVHAACAAQARALERSSQQQRADGYGRPGQDQGQTRSPARYQPPRHGREQGDHRGHGQGEQPRVQRGEAADVLQVQAVHEQETAEGGEGGDRDDGRPGEGRTPEEPYVEQRLHAPVLHHDQRGGRGHGDDEQAHDQRRRPAAPRTLDQGVGEGGQHHDDKHLAGRIEPAGVGRP